MKNQQAEGRSGASTGLTAIHRADGTVLTPAIDVEEEVESYFTALFQGRHVASNLRAGPKDSGTIFQSD
jgi:hypothetical protein